MKFYKILALVSLFVLTASSAGAQTLQERRAEIENRIESIREQASSTKTEISEALEEGDMEESCVVVNEHIDNRLSSFVDTHTAHEKAYEVYLSRIQTISSKLQTSGMDVTKLNSDVAVLEIKIGKFTSDKATVVTALEATKQFSCGDSSDEFRQSVIVARDAQKILLQDSIDILGFIKTAIKNDLETIRTQYEASHS